MSVAQRIVSRFLLCALAASVALRSPADAPGDTANESSPAPAAVTEPKVERPSLAQLREIGRLRSRFLQEDGSQENASSQTPSTPQTPQANLNEFEATIKPILQETCVDCHGPDAMEGNIRIDTLDPNLISGPDSDWWSEVFAVITKGEMPPPDEVELVESERQKLVDWLSAELHAASIARRQSGGRSAFRRMTRYEYNYALQDLLGLPWDFAKDLPPEAHSEQGFENSSELLQMSVSQFETYHRIARRALDRATIKDTPQPEPLVWNIAMKAAAQREWPKREEELKKLREKWKDDPDKLKEELDRAQKQFREPPQNTAYYKELSSGRTARAEWHYSRAKYAFAPSEQKLVMPDSSDCVAILPNGLNRRLIVELGNQLPDEGMMRVTVRAARVPRNDNSIPSLQLFFGWQASNEGRALIRVSGEDTPITASPDSPQIIQWDVPLGEIYPRNSVRKTSPMGGMPSPSEYIRLVNSSPTSSEIQIDYVQVETPVFDAWPPASHRRIFAERTSAQSDFQYARATITRFMKRAWKRPLRKDEIDRKIELFRAIRPECETLEEAVLEVLATILSSPQFLYVGTPSSRSLTRHSEVSSEVKGSSDLHFLASRLSSFLWCSIPDEELLALADDGRLAKPENLSAQVQRMLDDPRSNRLAEHFVHQWLDMQLLEFINIKQNVRGFDPLLKEAMQHEPVALFQQILRTNSSVLDFLHSNYAMVNERLAQHYGLAGIRGNHFQKVALNDGFRRGGLLTQAGVLTMNSDWPDSHPLKRAIWLLESVLDDPPPPPPPAVPQIDLANPEIAKMTLKERIEDHRNHAACMSCHIKIDPWGIAFENYDALGQWRDNIQDKPVDASSELFNHQKIDGMDGLKRFLLEHRQDQFVRAMVSKLATYALGRSLSFADRAEVDAITVRARREGDGLRSVVESIVQSELFQSSE